MKIFSAEETKKFLSYPELIEALRATFKSGLKAPLRHHHSITSDTGPDSTLLLMPSWSFDKGYGGVKLVNVNPENNLKNIPSISASYLLFDVNTGSHLCLMDASLLTSIRTAAASALAASYLARADSSSLLVVGAGKVGSCLPDAFKVVLPITEVLVWDRNLEQSTALVERLLGEGWNARVAETLEEGVKAVDIISCATLAEEPIVKGEWLSEGQHVDLIGSFTPTMREVNDTAIKNAKVFVDTEAAIVECGEIKIPLENGVIKQEDIKASFYELCSEHKKWREPEDITIFKGVGHAVEDLAAATLVYQSGS